MITGRKLPVPSEKIWAAVYMDSQTECFELRTIPNETTMGMQQLYHKEYAIGSAVTDFLTVELRAWDEQAETIRSCLDTINAGGNSRKSFATLFEAAKYWLAQSALFVPFAAAIERLHLDHESGKTLRLDDCDRQMAYYRALQPRLRAMAGELFETEEQQDMRALYFSKQEKSGFAQYPPLVFGTVSLSKADKGAGGFFPYDNWLQEPQKNDLESIVTEILETEEPGEFVDFILYRYLTENLRFRVCKFCGRYFGVIGNPKTEYCDRLIEGSTKTCKETGSYRIYTKRKMEDPAVREYKRSYKAHNARIRYGLMTREGFNAWSQEAREKRDLCVAGKLTLDEFVAWLDSDKM